jgi:hypothetical protein
VSLRRCRQGRKNCPELFVDGSRGKTDPPETQVQRDQNAHAELTCPRDLRQRATSSVLAFGSDKVALSGESKTFALGYERDSR